MKVKVLVAQSCQALRPPGSSVHGILQASILEGVVIPFSRGSYPPRDWTRVSCSAGGFFTVWATRESSSSQPLERGQPLAGTLWDFVDQMKEEMWVLDSMVRRVWLDHSEQPKSTPSQLSTTDLQISSPGYCLLSSRWSWIELLVREGKKKKHFFFLQKNSSQYVSEAKNKEPRRKLQFVAFPLEGLCLLVVMLWTYSFIWTLLRSNWRAGITGEPLPPRGMNVARVPIQWEGRALHILATTVTPS